MAFFRTVMDRVKTEGRSTLGLHLVMGDDAEAKEGRVRVVQATMTKADAREKA